jgi:hypothetical protein
MHNIPLTNAAQTCFLINMQEFCAFLILLEAQKLCIHIYGVEQQIPFHSPETIQRNSLFFPVSKQ